MPRPTEEARALVDARRRVEDREHTKSGAIRRAVADVLSGDYSAESVRQ
jgi:hypothetical protein